MESEPQGNVTCMLLQGFRIWVRSLQGRTGNDRWKWNQITMYRSVNRI